jgi:predicted GNAT family N-acyltransferase
MKKLVQKAKPYLLCSSYEYGTPAYVESVSLRHDILRAPLNLEFTLEQLSEEWKDIHFGCFDGYDNLLACLILSPQENQEIKMRQVAVRADLQGKGVGKILVDASEQLSLDLGFEKMVLHARETAIPFYEKLNYKKVGKRFKEVGIPHFKMEKMLAE